MCVMWGLEVLMEQRWPCKSAAGVVLAGAEGLVQNRGSKNAGFIKN